MYTTHTTQKTDTSTLLGKYADLINKYGVGSRETEEFLAAYSDNKEFVELAQTANFLRTRLDRYQAQAQNVRIGRRRRDALTNA